MRLSRTLLTIPFFIATSLASAGASELVATEVLVAEQAKTKRGGSSTSIGTDAYDVRTQTAWFYGQRPIQTCFNHISAFGVAEKEAQQALESAIRKWKDYFSEKKIIKADPELSPNTNFALKGKCKGDEDLVVFFGTGPIFGGLQDLKAVQKLNFPVAYMNKTHMTRDLKWGKGYIRLVSHGYYSSVSSDREKPFPDWKSKGALEAVLIHEIGHVLGFIHTPGTVMSADLIEEVFNDQPHSLSDNLQETIDGSKQLVSCMDCTSEYRLKTPIENASFNHDLLKKLGFKDLAQLKLLRSSEGFQLSDGSLQLKVNETARTRVSDLKSLLSNFDVPIGDSSVAFHLYGSISSKGMKTPVILEYNTTNKAGAIVVRSVRDGEFIVLGQFEK